jgi:hypothetical protein
VTLLVLELLKRYGALGLLCAGLAYLAYMMHQDAQDAQNRWVTTMEYVMDLSQECRRAP